jgi:hypothetical protein
VVAAEVAVPSIILSGEAVLIVLTALPTPVVEAGDLSANPPLVMGATEVLAWLY